jgi:hypothetical protein
MNNAVGFCASNEGRSRRTGPVHPILRCAFSLNVQIESLGCCNLETAGADPVNPDRECFAEHGAGLSGRTNEVRDYGTASFDDAVAIQPMRRACSSRSSRLKLRSRERIGAHRIGIEHHRVEQRRSRVGKRCLAGAWQAHN